MLTQENETKRFAFYQAGKCLIQTLLLQHPKTSILKVTEPSSNNVLVFNADSSLKESPNLFSKKAKLSLSFYNKYTKATRLSKRNKKQSFLFAPFAQPQQSQALLQVSVQTTSHLKSLLIGFSAGKAGEFINYHTKFGLSGASKNFIKQIPLLEHNKVTLPIKQRKNLVRLIKKGSYKKKQNKVLPSCRELSRQTFGSLEQSLNKTLFCYALHKVQLPREHHYSVLAPLDYSLLTNRLNDIKITQLLYQSDMGLLERIKATFLVRYLLLNQCLYAPNILNLQGNCRVGNLNKTEISDIKVFTLFSSFKEQINNVFLKELDKFSSASQKKALSYINVYSTSFSKKREYLTKKTDLLSQKRELSFWCEERVCKALMFSKKSYGHWFRIYLPQIETHQRQPLSRDQYFKTRSELELSMCNLNYTGYTQMSALLIQGTPKLVQKSRKSSVAEHTFNSKLDFKAQFLPQDFGHGMCHNLLVNTFSEALNIIGQNRELLDMLTDHLIRFGKIRLPEIVRICRLYADNNSLIYEKVQDL